MSGCTASKLELQDPIYSDHSDKSVDKLVGCISSGWVDIYPTISTILTNTGYKLVVPSELFGVAAVAIVDRAKDGGSDVKIYVVSKGWGDPRGNIVKSCM